MSGEVSLMNRALRVFAGSRVISPDDSTAEAAHCKAAWDEARDTVLAVYPWGFAVKWARLAKNADAGGLGPARTQGDTGGTAPHPQQGAPAFGFKNSYALPADFLYLLDIRAEDDLTAQPERHCIAAGPDGKAVVYADADQALARYVFRHEHCALWPEHFCEAFALRLAAAVAPYLVQDAGIGVKLREMYQQALAFAMTADAKQDFAPSVKEPCDYIDGRQG
jgi:hypothetical protein